MASIKPDTSKGHDLGSADKKWGTVHTGDLRTETITTSGNVIVGGTLTVTGASIVAEVETISAVDPLISLAKDNTADAFDIGFYGKSVAGGDAKYHGIVRDADDSGKFKVFKDAAGEPTTTVGAHSVATVVADLEVPAGSELNLPMSNGTLADYVTAVTLGSVKASKVLTVDANKDLDGLRHLTMTGTLTAGNVTIAGSSITVDGGAPNFDSVDINGGSIDGTAIGAATPASIVATTLSAQGNVDLGNANTDTLTITAKVDSDVIPTGQVDLGASDSKWAEAHVVAASVETLTASGNVDLGDASTDLLTVNASINSDLIPEADGTRSLGSSANRWAHLHADNITANSLTAGRVLFAGTDGKLVDDADLSFTEATLTATNVSATSIDTTNLAGFTLTGPANLASQNLSNLQMISGTIDGATIETSDINITAGKTLDVTLGTLTTTATQKLAIIEGLADNADPDLGNNTLTAEQFISDVATGTAPLQVTSTTKVANLNVDLLDGADWANPAHLGSSTPAQVTASSLTSTGNVLVQGDLTLSGEDGALTFDAASSVKIADNSNVSLVIEQADNAYMTFDTTDDAEKVILHKNLDASGLVLTASTFAGNATSAAKWDDSTTIVVGGTYFSGSVSIDGSEGADAALNVSINNASVENSKLANSSMDIAGQTVALGADITAASIAAAIDSENMALTAVTDLDGAAGSLTIFDNLNSAGGILTIGHANGVVATPADLSVTGTMLQSVDLATGKEYKIAASTVLSADTLGSSVVNSSLTQVAALSSGSIATGFGQINTASTITTTADLRVDSDASALVLGDDQDAKILFDGTDLSYRVGGSGSSAVHSFETSLGEDILALKLASGVATLNMPSNAELKINNAKIIDADSLGTGVLTSSLTSVGALDSGSIISGFGSVDVGASQIQTSGTISAGILAVDNIRLDGSTIGHSSDLDLMTLSSGTLSVAGRLDATTLAINSTDITSTAKEVNILDADQTAVGTTAVADGHGLVMQQAGVTTLTSVQTLAAYLDDEITSMPNLASASALATVGSITQGTWQADDVAVPHGGTGVSSLTDHGVVLGSGTDPVSVTSAGTNGQLLIAGTGVDPAFATLNAADGLSATLGSNSLQLDLDLKANGGCVIESSELALDLSASAITGTLAVTDGGTGLSTIESGNVLYASADDTIAAAAPGSTSGVQAWASDLDTLSAMQSGASVVAATLTAAEFAYLDKSQAVGVAEASKALVLDTNASITSGLSTLTASTITDGTASLNAGVLSGLASLTVDNINIDSNTIKTNSGDLTLDSASGSLFINYGDSLTIRQSTFDNTGGSVDIEGTLSTDAVRRNVILKTSNYTFDNNDQPNDHIVLFDATSAGGNLTFTLPAANDSNMTFRECIIKNIGTSNNILVSSTSDIDAVSTTLTPGDILKVISTTTKWCQI